AVPQIALLPKRVVKLSSFLETWVPKQSCGFAEVAEISLTATALIASFGDAQKAELQTVIEAMKNRVRNNLEHMIALHQQTASGDVTQAQKANDAVLAAQ